MSVTQKMLENQEAILGITQKTNDGILHISHLKGTFLETMEFNLPISCTYNTKLDLFTITLPNGFVEDYNRPPNEYDVMAIYLKNMKPSEIMSFTALLLFKGIVYETEDMFSSVKDYAYSDNKIYTKLTKTLPRSENIPIDKLRNRVIKSISLMVDLYVGKEKDLLETLLKSLQDNYEERLCQK